MSARRMRSDRLSARVDRLRRQWLAVRSITALLCTAVVGLTLMLALGWIDVALALGSTTRALFAIASVPALLVVAFVSARAAWRTSDRSSLAGRLDKAGRACGQIRTAVALADDRRGMSGLTATLADLAIERGATLTSGIPARAVLPVRACIHAASLALIVTAVTVIVALASPRLARTQWLRFTDPYGSHPPYSLTRFDVEPGHVSVPYGGDVDIRVGVTGPQPDRLELVVTSRQDGGDAVLDMLSIHAGQWQHRLRHVTEPVSYFVRTDRARSGVFQIAVEPVPKVERVQVRITPPLYASHMPYAGPVPGGGITGLEGTRIDMHIRSDQDMTSAMMHLETDDGVAEIPSVIAPDDRRSAGATFDIQAGGRLRISLTGINGQAAADPYTIPVKMVEDEAPRVRLVQPPAKSLATPESVLPVAIVAEDDIAVETLELYRSLNYSRPLPLTGPSSTIDAADHRWSTTIDLSMLGLVPGDRIQLFARAIDNHPGRPQSTYSPAATVLVVSAEQYEKLLVVYRGPELLEERHDRAQQQAREIGDRLHQLLESLKDRASDQPLSVDQQRQLDQLRSEMLRHASELRRAGEESHLSELDEELRKELERLAALLEQAARDLASVVSDDKVPPDMSALKDLLAGFDRQMKEIQSQLAEAYELPKELLARTQTLLADEMRFGLIYRRQLGLADRIERLADAASVIASAREERTASLHAGQQEIRRRIETLLDDIDRHRQALPDDARVDSLRDTAEVFTRQVRGSGVAPAMLQVEEALDLKRLREAGNLARQVAHILGEFVQQTGNDMGEAAGGGALHFAPSITDFPPPLPQGRDSSNTASIGPERSVTAIDARYEGDAYRMGWLGEPSSAVPSGRSGAGHEAPSESATEKNDGGGGTAMEGRRPATGEPQSMISGHGLAPPVYHRQVADYFRRVARDTGAIMNERVER